VESFVAWWEHGEARIRDTLRSCVLGGDRAVEMGEAAADSERMEFEVKGGLLTRAARYWKMGSVSSRQGLPLLLASPLSSEE
jgi:hypothetical protein